MVKCGHHNGCDRKVMLR